MKVGDIVGWQDFDDEPELRGKVIEYDEQYDYATARYTDASGRDMTRGAPSKDFRFIMGSV